MLIVLLHDEQLLIGIATGIAIPINDFFSASLCLKNLNIGIRPTERNLARQRNLARHVNM